MGSLRCTAEKQDFAQAQAQGIYCRSWEQCRFGCCFFINPQEHEQLWCCSSTFSGGAQIRVLLFMAALTYGIMEGMAALERAVVTAVGKEQHMKQLKRQEIREDLMRDTLLSLLQNEARLYAAQGEPSSTHSKTTTDPINRNGILKSNDTCHNHTLNSY
jgi:hypothetical protein